MPYVLLQNAMNVGITGGILIGYGHADTFFLYIAPHGMLELTSVFVAGAAGHAGVLGLGLARAPARAGRRSPRTAARCSSSPSA